MLTGAVVDNCHLTSSSIMLATLALVKSYGTEGRELLDTTGNSTFVPPQDVVHAYLLFRGQDIKDLHVHEKADTAAEDRPTDNEAEVKREKNDAPQEEQAVSGKEADSAHKPAVVEVDKQPATQQKQRKNATSNVYHKQRKNMVGTGASLLNKNMRGGKGDTGKIHNHHLKLSSDCPDNL